MAWMNLSSDERELPIPVDFPLDVTSGIRSYKEALVGKIGGQATRAA
jgi:hypothetical protein